MTEARWPVIRGIFEQVMELPAAQRPSALERHCVGDDQLRADVERLLRHHDEADGYLAPIPGETWTDPLDVSFAGQRINGYLIEREIAAGGMGVVYAARQESPRRRVALKMMRLDLSSPATRRRFEYESEILGRLRHPGIAQIYQAGTHRTALGGREVEVPFFAMEFVEGARSILAYADAEELDTEDRVRLFLRVCDAVHHGHQKGIIHRDLKPSNILVDADGVTKVIDFGIARTTDPQLTLTYTVDHIIGTLQYMSPEQLGADDHAVDVRSDVYGLGMVLFEMLCGRLPYDVTKTPIHEVARIIREQVPVRPSSVSPAVPTELDWIVLKALEKDAERRYGSTAELAADLRRYLRDEPVLASPPSATYRLAKFVRRNKTAVLAVAAVLLALVAGLVVSLALYRRAQRQERLATATNVYLDRWLSSVNPDVHGRDVKMRDLLTAAVADLERSFADQPLTGASLRATIGKALDALGEYERAESLLRSAHATRRALLGDADRQTLESAYSLNKVLQHLGRYREAEELLRANLGACRRHLGADDPLTLLCQKNLGVVLRERAQYDAAEACLRDALTRQRHVLGSKHEDTLASLMSLGELLRIRGKLEEAEELAREALAALPEVAGEIHSQTLDARNNLAVILNDRAKLADSEELQRQAIDVYLDKLGPTHPVTLSSKRNLADVLRYREKFEDAEKLLREVLDVQLVELGEDHPQTITTLNNLAVTLNESDRLPEAEAVYRRALAGAARVFGEDDARYAKTTGGLALVLKRQNKLAEAEQLYRQVLALSTAENHPDVLITMHNLAALLAAQNKMQEARELSEKTLQLRSETLGEDHPRTLATRHQLVGILRKLGELEAAEPLARLSAELHARVRGLDSRYTHFAVYRLGLVLKQADKWGEALTVFEDLLARAETNFGTGHALTEQTRHQYAECLQKSERYGDAEQQLLAGYRVLEERHGDKHPLTRRFVAALATLYEARGETAKAATYREKLAPRAPKEKRP